MSNLFMVLANSDIIIERVEFLGNEDDTLQPSKILSSSNGVKVLLSGAV